MATTTKTMNIGSATNNSIVNVDINGGLTVNKGLTINGGNFDYQSMAEYSHSEETEKSTSHLWVSGALGDGTGSGTPFRAADLALEYNSEDSEGYSSKFYVNTSYFGTNHITSGDILSYGDITVDAGATFNGPLKNALTVGDKTYDGSATVTISAADLGLSNALHFRGTTTVTNPSGTYSNGDVVLNTSTKKEYIYNEGAWIELGDESSYVLKETGKGLSTNDYTTAEKTKLAGLSNYTLPTATSTALGGVKIGSTLTISSGVLNYTLPTASSSTLGGVKIGTTTLTISNGVVNVKPATSSTIGGIKAGNNVTIASDGTLSIGGYLPLTGGTMTGDILSATGTGLKITGSGEITGVSVTTTNNNVVNGIALKALADGTTGLWDTDAKQWIIYSSNGNASTQMPLYGAVWNDYAEFRRCYNGEAGRCVVENGDDTMSLSTKRLQYGGIISDTFGFVIGDKDNGKPIAVSGRVLAYTDKDRKNFKPGDAVCSGPHGTVSKMTRKEIKEYPEKILGIVSAVPTYEFWGPKQIPVDGRVWIKVR